MPAAYYEGVPLAVHEWLGSVLGWLGATRVIAVIHRSRRGHLAYDILYKPSVRDRLLGLRPDCGEACEYEAPGCPVAEEYVAGGWVYLCSGDTAHALSYLRRRGILGSRDVEGLKRFLSRECPQAEIIVVDAVV